MSVKFSDQSVRSFGPPANYGPNYGGFNGQQIYSAGQSFNGQGFRGGRDASTGSWHSLGEELTGGHAHTGYLAVCYFPMTRANALRLT